MSETFVTYFSAALLKNDFTFGMKLDNGELYCVSHFQICRDATSGLPLPWNFTILNVHEYFVKDFLAPIDTKDLIFGLQLDNGELYCVSYFQICRAATSCLPISWNFTILSVHEYFVKDFLASIDRNDLIFCLQLDNGELYRVSDFQICRAATSCLPILWNFTIQNVHENFGQRFPGFHA